MPAPLCLRRRRLYEEQLTRTRKDLAALAGQYPLLASALHDAELIDALEEILNIYVVYGVARDLERLRASGRLFTRGALDPPALAEVLPPPGEPDPTKLPSSLKDGSVTPEKAYERYFSWYIDPADVAKGGQPKSGVAAFYERYPLLAHAVETVTAHHVHNIKLACERVTADWNAIQAAFFPGRSIERLVKIKTTGNDFHKGGKQVLILSFVLGGGQGGRVVYKPSAIEIDCRIAGDSTIVNAIAPKGPLDQKGYRQDESLTEILNRFSPPGLTPEGFTSRSLPTYRILPYNRSSVADAYGYIEFLTHGPELNVPLTLKGRMAADVGAAVRTVPRAQVKSSDWIVEDPQDGEVFFHQFGALLAIAMSISLSDLHVQNVITHDRRPHPIDLEDALKKPMTKVKDSGLTTAFDRADDPEGLVLTLTDDRTSKLGAGWDTARGRPAACALYLSHGSSAPAERLAVGTERNRKALFRGLLDVVDALALDKCHDAVQQWVRGLDATIARFVTVATVEYAHSQRELYFTYRENSITQLTQDDGYRQFKFRTPEGHDVFFFKRLVDERQKLYVDGLAARTWPHPFFALEHKDHVWRDFLNCDVPSFYHRLGSTDLLNSKGDTVDVAACVKWQRETMDADAMPVGWNAGSYLPQNPTDMVIAQLQELKKACATPAGKIAFLADALAGSSLESDFRKLSQRAPTRSAAREKVHS
jgi:hypothetical protein